MKRIEDLTDEDGIHCETEQQAKAILKMAHELGLEWRNGQSYLDFIHYSYGSETCYNLKRGTYCDKDYFLKMDYTIHKAADFIWQPKVGEKVLVSDNNQFHFEAKYIMTIDHKYPFIVGPPEGYPIGYKYMKRIPSESEKKLISLKNKYKELGEEIEKLESGGE